MNDLLLAYQQEGKIYGQLRSASGGTLNCVVSPDILFP
jgi:hypothetical protein